ncbi:hypothetical protein AJ80_06679 [Polytolypa hystricis UAMH7299]|uniref:JmjC domain-containing histone demethylation protein 1 n=1 Tax=Polytolypa hystricis (strain UAMH7299) TaxID=1447883 RepID=A0A2B7XVB3_POLH7|nr:hypothetical protein AJ80_06679 [Polytolypa hystricis UAMH7299]
MAQPTSFRDPPATRPALYRTPSPPLHAIEPLSPGESHPRWGSHYDDEEHRSLSSSREQVQKMNGWDGFSDKRGFQHHRSPTNSNAGSKIGAHSRSGSNIDTLATIALATSPTFAPLTYDPSTPTVHSSTNAMSISNDFLERPSKRPRSDKSPSPTRPKETVRPATSHASTLDSMKTDAELLLNFANRSSFPTLQDHAKPRTSTNGRVGEQSAEQKWATDTLSSRGGSWNMNVDNRPPPSAFFRNNGASPSRVRSRSDGSAAISRPTMNGLISTVPRRPSLMGPVLEDEPRAALEPTEALNSSLNRRRSWDQKPQEPDKPSKSPSESSLKNEDIESDSSSQKCAACNLVRVVIDGEDQAEVTWINCDGCNRWFHIVCAGFKNDREIRTVDKFICRDCRTIHGPTTFVRKSSRARTAIDYAGLNQGFVKSSTDTPQHHYIEPIKEGRITFLPDNFARIRPELMTAEYFERGIGMTEPVVIPAYLNSHTPSTDLGLVDREPPFYEAHTEDEFDEIIDNLAKLDDHREEVGDCGQDLLDMVIPDGLDVRAIAELYGPDERIEVIDVKSQQGEDKKWNMRKWADYYYENNSSKAVRNVISLEVSRTPLGRLLRRPRIVRELDLQDAVWPAELQAIGDFPRVQFYCLMSVADCYTDFHIDFGGSSVFYHILKGKKTFFFIPPKDKHLKKYEEWCNSAAQDNTFLGDQTKECYRVDLSEGDTMLIPSGWIHAVWTPEDSLVVGGNFLTRVNYSMQIKVAKIEKDTKVPRKFRYPFFQKILWYTALKYLEEDPLPQSIVDSFTRDESYRFYREYPIYYDFGEHGNGSEAGSEYYNARYYSQGELDGLPDLANYLMRSALIAGGYMVDGVTAEARNAVKRSIPKGQGDPVDTIRKFGIWIAWKRGNEQAAKWTRADAISLDTKVDMSEKKPIGRPSRRSNRHVTESQPLFSEKTTQRRPSDPSSEPLNGVLSTSSSAPSNNGTPAPLKRKISVVEREEEDNAKAKSTIKSTGLGPKRVACDACRKRRIRCRHKDGQNGEAVSSKPINIADSEGGQVFPSAALLHNSTMASNEGAAQHGSNQRAIHSEFVGPGDENGDYALLATPQNGSSKIKVTSPNSSNKKGRSKACDECRKSKVSIASSSEQLGVLGANMNQRRCIHDENGRIDPIKAQERSKPRAVGPGKRPRSSDENGPPVSNKRPKQEPGVVDSSLKSVSGEYAEDAVFSEAPTEHVPEISSPTAHFARHDELTEPNEDRSGNDQKPVSSDNDMSSNRASYASPPSLKADLVPPSEVASVPAAVPPSSSLVSPPTSLADDISTGYMDGQAKDNSEDEHTSTKIPVKLQTPTSASHPPAPPLNERVTVDETPTAPQQRSILHKASSPDSADRPAPVLTQTAMSSSSLIRKSISRPTSSGRLSVGSSALSVQEDRRMASPIDRRSDKHMSPSSPHRSSKSRRERVSFVEADTDPDSLKLIKELQEQEFGLRRRGRS